jgi:hypothetical protein
VSTFYVLPPRPQVGREVARFLQGLFPGLDLAGAHGPLAEAVAATAAERIDVFVVFREDLPDGVPLPQALVDDFGAAPGDEVVEASGSFRLVAAA